MQHNRDIDWSLQMNEVARTLSIERMGILRRSFNLSFPSMLMEANESRKKNMNVYLLRFWRDIIESLACDYEMSRLNLSLLVDFPDDTRILNFLFMSKPTESPHVDVIGVTQRVRLERCLYFLLRTGKFKPEAQANCGDEVATSTGARITSRGEALKKLGGTQRQTSKKNTGRTQKRKRAAGPERREQGKNLWACKWSGRRARR